MDIPFFNAVSDNISDVYRSNMGIGIGQRLRSVAITLIVVMLLLAPLTCTQPEKAYARANLTTYLTIQPNSWEMSGYNVRGTAANLTVDTVGWNNTKIRGNVGLGDGSLSALKQTSNSLVNYSENNFMAGDVSEAPWDFGRITTADTLTPASEENTDVKSADGESGNAETVATDTKEKPAETENNTSQNTMSSYSDNSTMIRDAYHPIMMGRPTDDLLYEDPLVVTGTAYCRLIGLAMPGGGCLNVGMRTLGYGY